MLPQLQAQSKNKNHASPTSLTEVRMTHTRCEACKKNLHKMRLKNKTNTHRMAKALQRRRKSAGSERSEIRKNNKRKMIKIAKRTN